MDDRQRIRQKCGRHGRTAAIALAAIISLFGCGSRERTIETASPISFLGAVPGKMTVDQFRDQFKVVDIRETRGKGVIAARAGRGADLNLGPLELTGLTGVFVDDKLFELHGTLRAADSARFSKYMTDQHGAPEKLEGLERWAKSDAQVIYQSAGGGVASGPAAVDGRFVLSFRPLASEAIDRGYDGIIP